MKVIDAHAHYGKWFFPILSDRIDDMLDLMRRNGIEKSVVSSTLGAVYHFAEGNAELAAAIEGYEEFLGYVVVNPNYVRESIEEIERLMESPQFVGLKIHPTYTGRPIDCDGNREILCYVSEHFRDTVALIHTWGEDAVAQMERVAREFPDLTFILGHMGGTEAWREASQVVQKLENAYLEICCSTPERSKIEEAVGKVGAHRIVFGSDSTLINPAFMLGTIVDAQISDEEKRLILYENAKRIFQL